MSNHATITAAPYPITLGGTTYRMKPLTDADIAELDQWLRARIIRTARESLPDDASEADRRLTMESAVAFATTVTWMSGHGAKLMATLEGMAQLVWQGCHHLQPAVTPEEIRAKLLDPRNLEEARLAFDTLNNSQGSKKKPTARNARARRRR